MAHRAAEAGPKGQQRGIIGHRRLQAAARCVLVPRRSQQAIPRNSFDSDMRFHLRDLIIWIAGVSALCGILTIASPRVDAVVIVFASWLIAQLFCRKHRCANLTLVLCIGPCISLLLLMFAGVVALCRRDPSYSVLSDDALVEGIQVIAIGMLASLAVTIPCLVVRGLHGPRLRNDFQQPATPNTQDKIPPTRVRQHE
jgi:hypothetical protein